MFAGENWITYLSEKRSILEFFVYFIIIISFLPKFFKRYKKQAQININEYNDNILNFYLKYQPHHHSCCSQYKKQDLNDVKKPSFNNNMITNSNSIITISNIRKILDDELNNPMVILPCCHDYCHCQHCNIVDNCNNIKRIESQQKQQQQQHYNKIKQQLEQQQQQSHLHNIKTNRQQQEMQVKRRNKNEIKSKFQGYNNDGGGGGSYYTNGHDKNLCNGICINRDKKSVYDDDDISCDCQENQLQCFELNGFKSTKSAEYNDYDIPKITTSKNVVTKMAKMFEKNSNYRPIRHHDQNKNYNNILNFNDNNIKEKKKKIARIPDNIVKRNKLEFTSKFEKFKDKENFNFENQKCSSLESLAFANNNIELRNQNNGMKECDFGGSNEDISLKPAQQYDLSEPIKSTITTSTSITSTTVAPTENETKLITNPIIDENLLRNQKSNNNSNNDLNNIISEDNINFNNNNLNSNFSLSNELLSTSPVHSFDEILSQRRFSRPFSQYSISDLLQNSDLKDDDLINANFENIS